MGIYKNSKNVNLAIFFMPFFVIAFSVYAQAVFVPSNYVRFGGMFAFLGWILLVVSKWPQMTEDKFKLGIIGDRPVRRKVYFLSYLFIGIGILLALFSLFGLENQV